MTNDDDTEDFGRFVELGKRLGRDVSVLRRTIVEFAREIRRPAEVDADYDDDLVIGKVDRMRYRPPQADGRRLRTAWLQHNERRPSPANQQWTRLSFNPQSFMRLEALCILDTEPDTLIQQMTGGGYEETELDQFRGLTARLFDPKCLDGKAPSFELIADISADSFKVPLKTHLTLQPGWPLELDISGAFSDAAMWGVALLHRDQA